MTIFEFQNLLESSPVFKVQPGTIPVYLPDEDTFVHINIHWRTHEVQWFDTIRIDVIDIRDKPNGYIIQINYGSKMRRTNQPYSVKHNLDELTLNTFFDLLEIKLYHYTTYTTWRTNTIRDLKIKSIFS